MGTRRTAPVPLGQTTFSLRGRTTASHLLSTSASSNTAAPSEGEIPHAYPSFGATSHAMHLDHPRSRPGLVGPDQAPPPHLLVRRSLQGGPSDKWQYFEQDVLECIRAAAADASQGRRSGGLAIVVRAAGVGSVTRESGSETLPILLAQKALSLPEPPNDQLPVHGFRLRDHPQG